MYRILNSELFNLKFLTFLTVSTVGYGLAGDTGGCSDSSQRNCTSSGELQDAPQNWLQTIFTTMFPLFFTFKIFCIVMKYYEMAFMKLTGRWISLPKKLHFPSLQRQRLCRFWHFIHRKHAIFRYCDWRCIWKWNYLFFRMSFTTELLNFIKFMSYFRTGTVIFPKPTDFQ